LTQVTAVLKLGGELLDDAAAMRGMAGAVGVLARRGRLVVVHGGGRAIDAELRLRGLEPRFVDGLRITDRAALDTVVSVLAGRTNTAFIGALHAAGVCAVGLTGADCGIGHARRVPLFTSAAGGTVDLGFVGQPDGGPVVLLHDLTALGYVPVVASIGIAADGTLLNVNADTLAGHLAAELCADRLVIAGATAGVLDQEGNTIDPIGIDALETLIASGAAHSGMIAKLAACRAAIERGVGDVRIVAGQGVNDFDSAAGTRVMRVPAAAGANHHGPEGPVSGISR
jgi:acetylglutamate kinase